MQRLNRTEYANAVRSLLGIEIKVQDLLPPEIEVDGFDNIAAALTVSPSFLDQYIGAARIIANQAVGEAKPRSAKTLYPATAGDQDSYVDGMPLGTRGGMRFTHIFPADGEYHLNILDLDVGLYPRLPRRAQTLVVVRRWQGSVPRRHRRQGGSRSRRPRRRRRPREDHVALPEAALQVKAGAHEVVVTFVERARALSDEYVGGVGGQNGGDFGGFGRLRLARFLDGIEIEGPFGETRAFDARRAARRSSSASRRPRSEEAACAQQDRARTSRAAPSAGPSTDDDLDQLMPFFAAGPQGTRQLRRRRGVSGDRGARRAPTSCIARSGRGAEWRRRSVSR